MQWAQNMYNSFHYTHDTWLKTAIIISSLVDSSEHQSTKSHLPDTGGPSETYETSRSSAGRVTAGDAGGIGDTARHGYSYNDLFLTAISTSHKYEQY